MKKIFLIGLSLGFICSSSVGQIGEKGKMQAQVQANGFTVEKNNAATPVKNQARTGTCWSFSTTSLLESQYLKTFNKTDVDLSEMFFVYNMYIEKAKNYVLRQGKAQFGEGGLGHDVIRAVATYGAMPESVYSGLRDGEKTLNHSKVVLELKTFLDSLLKQGIVRSNWMDDYIKLLDHGMGKPPAEFEYAGKKYTPKTFAAEVLKFNSNDYVNLTSFTHHPFYSQFILEVPDNFSNGSYYNVPMADLMRVVRNAINKGYTVMWDADVSNSGFMNDKGLGMFVERADQETTAPVSADDKELEWTPALRQQYYESLTTQDDHLMHITGLEKSKAGKQFFIVKNSWGDRGPYQGFINISEAYFAMNTVSLVVPKAAIDPLLLQKLGIR
ncbi:MAG: aminopeptidase [Bacteroidetes bacterium]|nr:aminopeptidase [Bacteroidota bacterium]